MKIFEWTHDRKQLLSLFWIFLTVNYIYCDVFTLHDAQSLQEFITGESGGIKITEQFLLYFAIIMQIPMIMIVLSRVLVFSINKYANVVAAIVTGLIQSFTVFMGGTPHYIFFSIFEIATAALILFFAITWKK